MQPTTRRLGAELLTMAQKAQYPVVPKPGQGAADAFFASDQTYRQFPARKAYLFDTYERIFAGDRLILAFQNNNLTHSHLQRIKQGLGELKTPPGWDGPKPRLRMTVVRSGILGAVVKKHPELHALEPLVNGAMFLVTSKDLHPSLIPQVLALADKATGFRPSSPNPSPSPFNTIAELQESSEPISLIVNPRTFCVGGLVDDYVLTLAGLRTLGTMPGLKELQGQIIALLQAPAGKLLGIVNAAGGGQLSRVVEGLKQKLEASEAPPAVEGAEEKKAE